MLVDGFFAPRILGVGKPRAMLEVAKPKIGELGVYVSTEWYA
jgi:hypothetical protein